MESAAVRSGLGGTASPAVTPSLWPAVAARAVIALVLGLVLTFAQDRSAVVGLLAFGIASLASGVLVEFAAGRGEPSARRLVRLQGGALLLGGAAALALSWAGPGALVAVVAVTGVLAGVPELVAGLRARGAAFARDQVLAGGLTVLLGVVVALVPPGYAAAYHGLEPVAGVLTASLVVAGVIGGWAIIVGVFLGIAAVSLRDAARRSGAEA